MPITLWNEISNRPQFIPLPIPKDKQNNEGDIKYEDYENLKYLETSEIHRPSYVFSERKKKEAKLYDIKVSKETRLIYDKSQADTSLSNTLWSANNICYTIKCHNCTRPRCVYA